MTVEGVFKGLASTIRYKIMLMIMMLMMTMMMIMIIIIIIIIVTISKFSNLIGHQ